MELDLIVQQLRIADDDPVFSMGIYEHPKDRFPFLQHITSKVIVSSVNMMLATNASLDAEQMYVSRHNQVMSLLNDNFWSNMYPAHDSHFHRSLEQYLNCPFTCLTEIVDCIEKIARKRS